ncbi:hypothetical protein BDP81DRAFT_120630 [Colletotrichum phormii]|uniref:Uncharacterized protein n=1 Tax=Colletotrichum phormii TaxID=359342 RepID=A0AAI9ZEZ8_9PEZI|nr:uncharacterized protein BDP81DRAFT_120630 [Colletotrichum phormii]KAK1623333.1 hypothetical protein BDP81DRAFT_120630 [Colletotrichum phormii]
MAHVVRGGIFHHWQRGRESEILREKKKTQQGANLHLTHGVCEFEHCGQEVTALIRKRAFQQISFFGWQETSRRKYTKRREDNRANRPHKTSNNFVWARGSTPRGESAEPWVFWTGGSARVGSKRRDGVADYSTLFGRLRRPRHRASGGSPRSSKTRRDGVPSITSPLAQSFLCLFMVGQVVH